MTGYDVIKRAMHLLGYSGQEGDPSESNSTALKGLEIINQLLPDLNCNGIFSLLDSLEIPKAKEEALIYGAAMLLALTEDDANKNHLFAEMYNAKRATALAEISGVKDTLPKVITG